MIHKYNDLISTMKTGNQNAKINQSRDDERDRSKAEDRFHNSIEIFCISSFLWMI